MYQIEQKDLSYEIGKTKLAIQLGKNKLDSFSDEIVNLLTNESEFVDKYQLSGFRNEIRRIMEWEIERFKKNIQANKDEAALAEAEEHNSEDEES